MSLQKLALNLCMISVCAVCGAEGKLTLWTSGNAYEMWDLKIRKSWSHNPHSNIDMNLDALTGTSSLFPVLDNNLSKLERARRWQSVRLLKAVAEWWFRILTGPLPLLNICSDASIIVINYSINFHNEAIKNACWLESLTCQKRRSASLHTRGCCCCRNCCCHQV